MRTIRVKGLQNVIRGKIKGSGFNIKAFRNSLLAEGRFEDYCSFKVTFCSCLPEIMKQLRMDTCRRKIVSAALIDRAEVTGTDEKLEKTSK